MRVYVDVDDTLIHWRDADEWEPDERLLAVLRGIIAMDTYQDLAYDNADAKGKVIIWSTGGADYARDMWVQALDRVFPHQRKWNAVTWNDAPTFLDKYPAVPEPGDLFFDDDPLESFASHTVMFPRPKR